MTSISKDKIEKFKVLLKKPFWEIYEAFSFLVGHIDMDFKCLLDDLDKIRFGIENYGIGSIADLFNYETTNIYDSKIFHKLFKSVENGEITTYVLKLNYGSRNRRKYTYLVKPREILFLAISQGMVLPIELQDASNIHQTNKDEIQDSKTYEKHICRLATAQLLWNELEKPNISKICREMDSLKKHRGIHYLNSSANRAREIIKEIKPCAKKALKCIPEVLNKINGITYCNFQSLQILIETLVNLIQIRNPKVTINEAFCHPIVKLYTNEKTLQEFAMFSLRKEIEIENQIDFYNLSSEVI